MEASALKHASGRGLLARRSPLLRLQGDERLIAMIRAGHDRAFEVLFDRYHARLLAFCRHMLRSSEDAEDVLQEVFTKAHAAILADERRINARPWLYRIARNRCLNHLRKPVPEGRDSMDVHPHEGGTTTADRVQRREDFRALVADVQELPETQRMALLLREIDALSYDEIAESMETTVPAVKSLLVRARMSLAEATQSRVLSCGDVQLELAEAAEGLHKVTGPARHHVRHCEECRGYRSKLRSNGRELASLAPAVLLVWLQKAFGAGLFGLGKASAVGGGAAACGGAAAGGGAATAAGGAASGISGILCAKAAAGVATAALVTAGAVEVRQLYKENRSGPQGTDAPLTTQGAPSPQGTAPIAALAAGGGDSDGGEPKPEQAEKEVSPPADEGDEVGGELGAEAEAESAAVPADDEASTQETPEATGEDPEGEGDGDGEKTGGGNQDSGGDGHRARGSQATPAPLPEPIAPCEGTGYGGSESAYDPPPSEAESEQCSSDAAPAGSAPQDSSG